MYFQIYSVWSLPAREYIYNLWLAITHLMSNGLLLSVDNTAILIQNILKAFIIIYLK